MATIEKVGIEIVGKLDKPSFQKAEDNVVQFARDTKKKLDPLLVQDLRLNLANLQMGLDEARNKLKQAKKKGDKDAELTARMNVNKLQSDTTEAKRILNNYTNTGEKSVSRLQSKFNQIGAGIKKMAIQVGAAFVAMFAVRQIGQFFKSIVNEAIKGERAITQLNAVIKSTGGGVGFTGKEIKKMADELQKITGIADDVIQSAQNMLLTFVNIKGDQFKQATAAVLDLATAMNSGATPSSEQLKASSIQLGKALNDPIKGISALTRVGIQFTDTQKQQIANFVKGGEVAKAQEIILEELNRQFGGSAQAQLDTYGGKVKAVNAQWGDFKELLGNFLIPLLSTLMTGFSEIIGVFDRFIGKFSKGRSDVAGLNFGLYNTNKELKELDGLSKSTDKAIDKLNKRFLEGKITVEEYRKEAERLFYIKNQLEKDQQEASKTLEKLNVLEEKKNEISSAYIEKQKEVAKNGGLLLDKSKELNKEVANGNITQQEATDILKKYSDENKKSQLELGKLGEGQRNVSLLTNILENSTLDATEAKELLNKTQTNTGKSQKELKAEQAQVRALTLEYIRIQQIKQKAMVANVKSTKTKFLDFVTGGKSSEKQLQEIEAITDEVVDLQKLLTKPIELPKIDTAAPIKLNVDDTDVVGAGKSINKTKEAFKESFDSINREIENSQRLLGDYIQDIENIRTALDSLKSKRDEDLASRVVSIDQELAKTGEQAVSTEERAKLEAERAEAFVGMSEEEVTALQEQIDALEYYNSLTDIGKIKKDYEEKKEELEKDLQLKIEAYDTEMAKIEELNNWKNLKDQEYHALYTERVNQQIKKQRELEQAALAAARAMSRGGDSGGSTSSVTNNNQKTTTVNATISSNIGIDSLINKLSK